MKTNAEIIEESVISNMFREYPDILNVTDLCKILGISRKLAYRILKEGSIKYLKIGRSYKIPRIFLLRYLCKN